jgi:hypothetical protein
MRTPFALVAMISLATPLAGQGASALYTRWNGLSGFEFQTYHFSAGLGVQDATQWSVPLVVVAPLGRQMSLDLTTHLAHSEVKGASSSVSFSGLTDTQLRLLYTLGRDRAVASLSFNLPTGARSVSTSQFQVASAIGSNFLAFPVSNLGTAFGVTGGAAYATQAGGWSVGVAGSLRYLGSYEPFTDQSISYNPGLEGRLRAGADRLIGQRSRLLVGLTFSNFSTDQFSGTGSLVSGNYRPGSRFIGDLGYAYTWGRMTLAFAAWDFYRLAGRTNGATSPETKENIFNAELRVGRQMTPKLVLEPLVAFRQWSPADYRGGRLVTFGLNGRVGISDQWSAQASARLGPGWVSEPGRGRADVTAAGISVFLRYQR